MKTILIVEDDIVLAEGIKLNLDMEGYHGATAYNCAEALEQMKQKRPGLVLLDVNLPDASGLELAAQIRAQSQIPIIFLTARDMDEDMLAGFAAGADDYITKPFNIKIVLERIRAVLRRYETAPAKESLRVGNLEIDFDAYAIKKSGRPMTLTPTEFKLLKKFCMNPGIVLTREVLLQELWDVDENYVDEHTLTIFISRLRTKIGDGEYTYLKTVYGIGYVWMGENHE